MCHMGMRPIYLPSPGRCGSRDADSTRFHRLIPESQVIPPGLSARDECLEGKGESGPESNPSFEGSLLSPIRLQQSRVSPGRPVG